ncbi:MAG: PTS sugar transporter subunit IIA [Candidatus Aminicenantia bacterium]
MKLSQLLKPDLIIEDLKGENVEEVLKEMVNFLKNKNLILKERELCQKLLERERLGSTGIGEGIAIPHCKFKGVSNPVVLLAISRKGVKFNSLDGKPSYVFFLVISSPVNPSLHLQILAAVAHIARKGENLIKAFLKSKNLDQILKIIRNEEENLSK